MSFIAGAIITSAVVGTAGAVIGASKQSSAAKKAARIAAEGSEREIQFQRESRDLARSDQAPYREAGYKALDALMSMTGLGGGKPAPIRARRGIGRSNAPMADPRFRRNIMDNMYGRGTSYKMRYAGGPTESGTVYNINELGPEDVYSGGRMRRNPNPATIDGQTGYVQPNVEGRAYGGPVGMYHDAYKNIRDPGGPPVINNLGPSSGQQTGGPNTANSTNPNTGYPNENPGGVEGGYNFMTDPGYQFRFSEGQKALERGAAARGGLLSGGTAKQLIRYGQGFASNEYGNVYNRIANIAGLGQVSSNASGNYAMMAGQGMGTAAAQGAYARASGYQAAGNAWANAGNQIAQLPWDKIWGPRSSGDSGAGQGGYGPI